MNRKAALILATGSITLLGLTGCGGGTGPNTGSGADQQTTSQETAPASNDVALGTADTSLGTIVVDGTGMSVYYFDKDKPDSGKSTCYESCASAWPPVVAESQTPQVEGVTAEVDTITRKDGTLQVTVDGLPVYTFAQDTAAGDVTGQGVNDIWWVLAPNGDKITETPMDSGGGY